MSYQDTTRVFISVERDGELKEVEVTGRWECEWNINPMMRNEELVSIEAQLEDGTEIKLTKEQEKIAIKKLNDEFF